MAKRAFVEEYKEFSVNQMLTPMLDVSFQLLSFFILFWRPATLVEGKIEGKLLPPEKIVTQSAKAEKKEVDPEKITDIEPDKVTEKVTVQIKAVAEGQREGKRGSGQVSQFKLHTQTSDRDGELIADSTVPLDVALAKLRARLEALRARPGGENLVINLQPDGNLKYEYVVEIWSACRSAGFTSVGFVAPTQGLKIK